MIALLYRKQMRSVTVKVHLHKPEQKHRTMTFAAFADTIYVVTMMS